VLAEGCTYTLILRIIKRKEILCDHRIGRIAMTIRFKAVIWVLIITGFVFGYAGYFVPGQTAILETPRQDTFQFQRLHVFFFNLVCGGTVLLYFTEGKYNLTWRGLIFLLGSLAFSIAAFLNRYLVASVLSLLLALVVDTIRTSRFSFFPTEFFDNSVSLSRKFHHAAVLCLSLGFLICAGVMIDNQYIHILNLPYLILDDFFLGFSFPISLATFAVIFSMAPDARSSLWPALGSATFWITTVGVIIFFVFIILALLIAEFIIATVLLLDVLILYYLFRMGSWDKTQEKRFLTSGMLFLIVTGVTGVLLVLWDALAPNDLQGRGFLLQTHAYLSLYGWNLVGLIAIIHYRDFPQRLNQLPVIVLHWITVSLVAPLGSEVAILAVAAIILFMYLTGVLLFSRREAALLV
jgi:hypothetical protein